MLDAPVTRGEVWSGRIDRELDFLDDSGAALDDNSERDRSRSQQADRNRDLEDRADRHPHVSVRNGGVIAASTHHRRMQRLNRRRHHNIQYQTHGVSFSIPQK